MTRRALAVLALVPVPALAQEVMACDPAPGVGDLIEPWEATTASLAEGAIRLAVIEGEQGTRRLLVLTLPPPDPAAPLDPAAPPPERVCRIVTEGGLGFADLDLARLASEEDPEAATLTLRLPALHFVPESTELAEEELVMVLGVADGSLAARIEGGDGPTEDGAEGEAETESEAP